MPYDDNESMKGSKRKRIDEELIRRRTRDADFLEDEDHRGIVDIVGKLYPDKTHFVYELLQNAEDAGAKEVEFILSSESLEFKHDGRAFDENDIRSITSIGWSTKKTQDDKIGKFGIGFKAVFAYTQKPLIWSPTYSFAISRLVIPTDIEERTDLERNTLFKFMFDNPEMTSEEAFNEISKMMSSLPDSTLLFLDSIKTIGWRFANGTFSEIIKDSPSKGIVRLSSREDGRVISTSHFLVCSEPVQGHEGRRVTVAYDLTNELGKEPLRTLEGDYQGLQISPSKLGRVSVSFTMPKEKSGLRFHIDAPFETELSRASVKDTKENDALYIQLAHLASKSLSIVRDAGLLTEEFLAVLPNSKDDIPSKYQSIRDSLIAEMKREPLVPTATGEHFPASNLYRARATILELVDGKDLNLLFIQKERNISWVHNFMKNSHQDIFIGDLGISEISIHDVVWAMKRMDDALIESRTQLDLWLSSKTAIWHARLYALINEYYRERQYVYDGMSLVRSIRMVRLDDGTYSIGAKCFFPGEDGIKDVIFPTLDPKSCSVADKKELTESARKGLEALGVCVQNDVTRIMALLDKKYREKIEPRLEDIHIFIEFLGKNPDKSSIFRDYYILKTRNGKWSRPGFVYLDVPFLKTDLRYYHETLARSPVAFEISGEYCNLEINIEKLIDFLSKIGAQKKLVVVRDTCENNPDWGAGGSLVTRGNINEHKLDIDYKIQGLEMALASPTVESSRTIWIFMNEIKEEYLVAKYAPNKKARAEPKLAYSQIVHLLINNAWIPQKEGVFLKPANAILEGLPNGFPFEKGKTWIEAIGFASDPIKPVPPGETVGPRTKKDRILSTLSEYGEDELERMIEEHNRRLPTNLPNEAIEAPGIRKQRKKEEARAALSRVKDRGKTLPYYHPDLIKLKKEADAYLTQYFCKEEGLMICQICRTELPFKKLDGKYYFETTEFMRELKAHHPENYLALCANHAAMFAWANPARDSMRGLFTTIDKKNRTMKISLAKQELNIYFTEEHIADLEAIIESEMEEDEENAQVV